MLLTDRLGSFIVRGLNACGVILSAYIGPTLAAVVIRNIRDFFGHRVPVNTTNILGLVALQYFLAMTLMGMRLWEPAALAAPLVTMLILQTVLMGAVRLFRGLPLHGRELRCSDHRRGWLRLRP